MADGLCDICGVRPATVRAQVVSNGQRQTRELCDVDYRRLARQQRSSSPLESLFGERGSLFDDFFTDDFLSSSPLAGARDPVDLDLQASTSAPTTIVLTPEPSGAPVAVDTAEPAGSSGEAGQYSTPAPRSVTSIAPPARLANYVVAHSEYSGPLSRRMALLGIVGTEAGEGGTAAPEADAAADASGANGDGQGDVGQ